MSHFDEVFADINLESAEVLLSAVNVAKVRIKMRIWYLTGQLHCFIFGALLTTGHPSISKYLIISKF